MNVLDNFGKILLQSLGVLKVIVKHLKSFMMFMDGALWCTIARHKTRRHHFHDWP